MKKYGLNLKNIPMISKLRKTTPPSFTSDRAASFNNGLDMQVSQHEYCLYTTSIMNSNVGTFEIEIDVNDACLVQDSTSKQILRAEGTGANDRFMIYFGYSPANSLVFYSRKQGQSATQQNLSNSLTPTNTVAKIGMAYDSNSYIAYVNGVEQTPQMTPQLPTDLIKIYLGGTGSGTELNSRIRRFVWSNIKRSSSDMLQRASTPSGFPIDKNCKLIAPLIQDFNTFKVV
jgi:hypothetical protein